MTKRFSLTRQKPGSKKRYGTRKVTTLPKALPARPFISWDQTVSISKQITICTASCQNATATPNCGQGKIGPTTSHDDVTCADKRVKMYVILQSDACV